MRYASGDTVVHPRHGVGTVQSAPGDNPDYLEMFFESKGLTIKVPVSALDDVGIRSLSSKADAEAILDLLQEPSDVSTVWAERQADTVSRMGSTDLAQAAMVVRDLSRHAARIERPLSEAEGTSLATCLEMVSLELSLVLGLSQSETEQLILDTAARGVESSPLASS